MVEDHASERRRAWCEVGAGALTVLLYVLCYEVLDVRGVFVVAAFLAWTAYVVFRCVRDPAALDRYGLGRRGLRSAAAAVAGVVVLGLGVCWAIGAARGTLHVSRGLLLALALYPLWGTVQQLLVQS